MTRVSFTTSKSPRRKSRGRSVMRRSSNFADTARSRAASRGSAGCAAIKARGRGKSKYATRMERKAPAPASVFELRKRRLAFGERGAVGVERQPDHAVIADADGEIDHAFLAEAPQGAREEIVAHALGLQKLARIVVDQRLVRRHRLGPRGLRDRVAQSRRQPGFEREFSVGVPFVLRAPMPRRHQYRQLLERRRQLGLEAEIEAELLY